MSDTRNTSDLKRICIASNYDKEMFFEKFVNIPAASEYTCHKIAELLNSINPQGEYYYKVVDLDYQLYEFQP